MRLLCAAHHAVSCGKRVHMFARITDFNSQQGVVVGVEQQAQQGSFGGDPAMGANEQVCAECGVRCALASGPSMTGLTSESCVVQGGTASGYGLGTSGQQYGDAGTGGGGFGAQHTASAPPSAPPRMLKPADSVTAPETGPAIPLRPHSSLFSWRPQAALLRQHWESRPPMQSPVASRVCRRESMLTA